jgi:single-strand DNA-binding protein
MSSVNKAILIGHLGRDPEVRRMNSGDSVVSFSLATSESWKDKGTGERKEKTDWHNVVIWNEHIGKVAEQFCKKGSKVYIEGQIQTREFTDKDGNQRKTTEIVLQRFRGELTLLDGRKADGSESEQPTRMERELEASARRADEAARQRNAAARQAPIDDDIQF